MCICLAATSVWFSHCFLAIASFVCGALEVLLLWRRIPVDQLFFLSLRCSFWTFTKFSSSHPRPLSGWANGQWDLVCNKVAAGEQTCDYVEFRQKSCFSNKVTSCLCGCFELAKSGGGHQGFFFCMLQKALINSLIHCIELFTGEGLIVPPETGTFLLCGYGCNSPVPAEMKWMWRWWSKLN